MPYQKFSMRPGIDRTGTAYSAEGGWYDANNVRFRSGRAESVGGWAQITDSTFLGSARKLHSWASFVGSRYGGIGTNLKAYVEYGNDYFDITPVVTASSGKTYTVEATDNTVKITPASVDRQSVNINDYILIANVTGTTLGRVNTLWNTEHRIVSIDTANSPPHYFNIEITGSTSGSTSVAFSIYYELPSGLDTTVGGTGWGTSTWGDGGWGSPSGISLIQEQLRIWSIDNFGEDLVLCPRGGEIFYWDRSARTSDGSGSGENTPTEGAPKSDVLPSVAHSSTAATYNGRAQKLSEISGAVATNLPVAVNQVVVSDRDRHVIALGCNHVDATTVNPLLVRWSDQGNPFDWNPTPSNTAGGQMIASGSEIIGGLATQEEVLIWTDSSLHRMRYSGPPYTFSFQLVTDGAGLAAPNAMVAAQNSVFFMGDSSFYNYSGTVRPLPSTLSDYVFDDINRSQFFKVFAGANKEFHEVYWFYCSASASEIDRYVVYNYVDNVWSFGSFDMTADLGGPYPRTTWDDASVYDYPRSTYVTNPASSPLTSSNIFNHEQGFGRVNGQLMDSFVESGFIDIGDGDEFSFVSRVIPDVAYIEESSSSGATQLDVSIKTKEYPTDTSTTASTTTVDSSTGQAQVRVRARSVAVRFAASASTYGWRLGDTRFFLQPDGRR